MSLAEHSWEVSKRFRHESGRCLRPPPMGSNWKLAMKTLKEFLSDRAEIERGRADDKKALQTEWIWAVRRLVQQIREWLTDADQERLLTIKEDYQEVRESRARRLRGPPTTHPAPSARGSVGTDFANGRRAETFRMGLSTCRVHLAELI